MSERQGFIPKAVVALGLLLLWPALAHAQGAPEQAPPQGYGQPQQGYAPPQGYGNAPPNYYAPPPSNYAPPPPPGYGYPPPRRYGYSQPAYYAPPVYQHDGFFLHLHIGGGYTSLTSNNNGDKMTISGGSLSLGMAAGGTIAPNLILFGTLYGNSITDPNISYNNGGADGGVASGTTATLIGLGVGLAYYLEPINVYFAGALAATWLDVSDSDTDDTLFQTNTGIGFQGMVGKEWWVARDWGLGVAAEITLASMKDSDYSNIRWSGGSFSILFSATYN